jgi:hypothetical protein
MVAAPDRPPFSSAFAFAAGSGSGSAAPGKATVPRTQDNGDALSAFMSSPVYTRVADAVASTVEAGPLFPLRGGLVCQRMTQTVKIDGQNVHASALMCRNPNGVWKIAVPPGSQDATTTRGSTPPADRKSNVPRPSPTGSPVAKVQ